MAHDPILSALLLRLQRAGLMVVGTGLLWVALFWSVLDYKTDLGLSEYREVWRLWCAAWPPAANLTLWLLFTGTGVIALLLTITLSLALALWWQRSGTVHKRGTQFIDHL